MSRGAHGLVNACIKIYLLSEIRFSSSFCFNKLTKFIFIFIIVLVVSGTSFAKSNYDLIGAGDKVYCYGDAFIESNKGNFCFGFIGYIGIPILASGGQWGNLSVLIYLGTAKYRGDKGTCEASYNGEIHKGEFWVSDGVINNYKYSYGKTIDSSVYCVFTNSATRPIMKAIYANDLVNIRALGKDEYRAALRLEKSDTKYLCSEFFRLVRDTTISTVPLDEYKGGIRQYLRGAVEWLGL